MTYENDCTLPNELMEQIIAGGLDVVPELIRTVLNTAMWIERQRHLGVKPYERSEQRREANGYKLKTVALRSSQVTFDIPRCEKETPIPVLGRRGYAAIGP